MSLAAVAALDGLGAVMLPKAESVEQIAQAVRTWGVAVLPSIEILATTGLYAGREKKGAHAKEAGKPFSP